MSTSSAESRPIRVFISYSHQDVDEKEQVRTRLRAFPPGYEIDEWDDTRMSAGTSINKEIFEKIEHSNVFLALISHYYLASNYCQAEMTDALRHAERRGLRVVPVIVRKTELWRDYPIGQNLALPPDGKAPTDWKHPDEHWAAVEAGLRKLFRELGGPIKGANGPGDISQQRTGPIPQDPIETVDESRYRSRLKLELTRSLSHDRVRPLVAAIIPEGSKNEPEAAADTLLALQPLDSIRRLTSAARDWLSNLSLRERAQVWDRVREVHLRLLPRLVDPAWIESWLQNVHTQGDKRLFTISIKPRPGNRSVEILVARLDPKRGTVRFDPEPDSPGPAAPCGQINTDHQALCGMQKPTADEAVQRIGRYLLGRFNPAQEPPDLLELEDWIDLNDQLVERPAGGRHYYYLVIPQNEPDFANQAVLQLLYERMPNLPRVLLTTEHGTASPLLYRQSQLEAVIDAFWDLRLAEAE